MFRATHRPSSGAQNRTGSLWFIMRGRLCGRFAGGRCQACRASYKYGIKKSDTLLHLVGFFFMKCTMIHGSTNVKFITEELFPIINPLNSELNPICYLLALLGAYHFLHVSRIRVKSLTFRRLMSYIYGAPILDVSRSHTTTQHSR